MVFGVALRIDTAIADATRINALVLGTGQVRGTIDIRSTASNTSDSLADLVAVAVCVGPANLLTHASNAKLVWQAVGINAADGFAEGSVALKVVRALFVGHTFHGLSGAADDGRGVGRKALVADAGGSLLDGLALGVGAARDARAGILTAVGDTSQ